MVLLATASPALAGDVVFRGNYYRDRNTRVLQPQAEITEEFGKGTVVGAHYLLDAITSASVAAGAMTDKPFTELRHEVGFRLLQRIGPGSIGASYSYSSESDYWAHTASISGSIDLFQKNTTLALALAYNHDEVGRRMGATSYSILGRLDALHIILGWSQVLSRHTMFNFSWDAGIIGFGSRDNGFQANAYRMVLVGSSPAADTVPFQRIRNAFALSLHIAVPLKNAIVPWIAFRPAYRLYVDDWGILGHTPELRVFVPVGPVEFRLTGRYHEQSAASFWADDGLDRPMYANGMGLPCTGCVDQRSQSTFFFTADPKLSAFRDYFLEARLLWRLTFLSRLSRKLGDSFVEVSYGHLFTTRTQKITFGDAHVAGLTFTFPF
jgi:hypothetical protein